jgi:hypothetical protein
MAIAQPDEQNILNFVDALVPGTRVIWLADGAAGTVQPDKSITWDNGHHMTRTEMKEQHALLIHSEEEKRRLRDALEARLKCLKSGCKLTHWDDDGFRDEMPERLCPVGVLMRPTSSPPRLVCDSRHTRAPAQRAS